MLNLRIVVHDVTVTRRQGCRRHTLPATSGPHGDRPGTILLRQRLHWTWPSRSQPPPNITCTVTSLTTSPRRTSPFDLPDLGRNRFGHLPKMWTRW